LPFDPIKCVVAVFHGRGRQLTIEKAAGEKTRFLRRRSFWQELLALASAPVYAGYSYRESADMYRLKVDAVLLQQIRDAARLLAYSSFESWVRGSPISAVDLFTRR
jgi:hypothetical protein